MLAQIAAYSSRLADKEEIMQNSNTDGEHVWNGGQIVGISSAIQRSLLARLLLPI